MTGSSLIPGANMILPVQERVVVAIGWAPNTQQGMEVDASAFLLGENDRVLADDGFVFYGSQKSPDGTVCYQPIPSTKVTSDLRSFTIDLDNMAISIVAIDLCLTIHEGVARGQNFARFQQVFIRVLNPNGFAEVLRFDLPVQGMPETAITLARIYKRQGQWKFRAVGQGFIGGLAPLAKHYGVMITDDAPVVASPPPLPVFTPPKEVAEGRKLILQKQGESLYVKKSRPEGFGEIAIHLQWHRPQKSGLLAGLLTGKGGDLNLGCLCELVNGQKGTIQAFGNQMGHFHEEPYILHLGEDQTETPSHWQKMRINGDQFVKIKRVLLFAFIYNAVPDWTAAQGVATLKIFGHPDIEIPLDQAVTGQMMCAIAHIDMDQEKLKITKETRYFNGHAAMDNAYHWGIRWGILDQNTTRR
ncbi:MAG: TerD domain-containing protein [Magnetococcus sp. DMHC-6]